jgi:predicted DNA-binding transcriptional regulator YafY
MTRAERLMDLADLLRGLDGTTVAALADELGVSERTVLRDLSMLRQRGMPITGEAGPGGGIRLEGSRGVTAVHLALAEIVALWLAATLSREASELPWGGASRSALSKLLASLPKDRARALRALCRRVIIGPPASRNVREGMGVPPKELLHLFEDAFTRGMGLGFDYVDRMGRRSSRRVEPHGLLVETPVWYVLGRDVDKAEPRMFRMDRIARPRTLADVNFRPSLEIVSVQLPDEQRWRPLMAR